MIKGAQDMLAGSATELAGFEIVDDYHFNITLEYPFAPFVKNIGTSYADIFPETHVPQPVRTGPWHRSDRYRSVQDCRKR